MTSTLQFADFTYDIHNNDRVSFETNDSEMQIHRWECSNAHTVHGISKNGDDAGAQSQQAECSHLDLGIRQRNELLGTPV